MKEILILLTTILLATNSSLGQRAKVRLLNYNSYLLCDSVRVDIQQARPVLLYKTLDKESITIAIRVVSNCSNDYYGAIIISKDTIDLLSIPKGLVPDKKEAIVQVGYKPVDKGEFLVMSCNCYKEKHYKISIPDNYKIPEVITLNGHKLYPPKELYLTTKPTYEILNGEKVNLTDSIGYKRGKWVTIVDDLISEATYYNYENVTIKDEVIDSVINYVYKDKILIKTIKSVDEFIISAEYYPNGNIKQECTINTHTVKPHIKRCRYFSLDGKLIESKILRD